MKNIQVLAQVASGQLGLCTGTDLEKCGVTAAQRKWALRTGALVIVQPGVYALAGTPLTPQVALRAACLASRGVAGRRSAAELWRLPAPRIARPEILVPRGHVPRLRGDVLIHRTDLLEAEDRTVIDGIPVTSLPRTVLDLGGTVRPHEVELAMEDAVLRLGASIAAFRSCLDRVGARGRNGTGVLRTLLDARDPAMAAPEGALNLRLQRLFRRHGLPAWIPEFWVTDGIRLDFAWPAVKFGVEGDSRRWHAGRMDVQRNAEKSNALTRLGWKVLHYTWLDCETRADVIVREITGFVSRTVE